MATQGTRPTNKLMSTGWGCYIAESGIAFFWSFSLAQAVYGWRDDIRFHRPLIIISEAGKVFPIFAAIFSMALLQIDALQTSYWWFSFVMNFFCQLRLVTQHARKCIIYRSTTSSTWHPYKPIARFSGIMKSN